MEKTRQAIEQLHKALIEEAGQHTTSVRLVFNCEGVRIETSVTTPESLKKRGISMRNIAGDFIK